MISPSTWLAGRLPFFYGWVVIGVAFVTMAIGVNSRTAFSLLYPPILDEFGWGRGVTAAAFSLGFVASIAVAPFTGVLMDRFGPRVVISLGAVLVSLGLVLTTRISTPLGLYLSLGGLVVGSSVLISYIGHSTFLPRWFVRKRGLAIGIAFAGVGVGSMVLFPALQELIGSSGWREACLAMAALIVVTIIPLNVALQRTQPEDLGLAPDGDDLSTASPGCEPTHPDAVVDRAWVEQEWTVAKAVRTARYWWVFGGLMTALYAWYAVQVHQTRYFIEAGFSAADAAWALGLVGLTGIVGQIGLGHLSDRIGREVVWTVACLGYMVCYALLIALPVFPSALLMYAIAAAQGLLGYGIAPVYGSIVAELFQGRSYGAIFGTLSVATTLGAASGPWITGLSYDLSGSYVTGFAVAFGCSGLSCFCMWMAAPRTVRLVAGRAQARRRRERQARAQREASTPQTAVCALAVRSTPIVLRPGESRRLTVSALDAHGGVVTAGNEFTWELGKDLTALGVRIEAGGPAHSVAHIHAGNRAGAGTLTITALGIEPPVSAVRQVRIG